MANAKWGERRRRETEVRGVLLAFESQLQTIDDSRTRYPRSPSTACGSALEICSVFCVLWKRI